jgi:cytochrome c-type biogenesis protein
VTGRIPVAFLAGLVSFVAPCVLPLVPGYLSAVSAVEADRLGERGTAKRVLAASLPFVAGFTALFVALGAGAGLLGDAVSLNSTRVQAVAGFVVVVLGLAFAGLLPFPERLVAPGLVGGARRSGSSALLGAAFAVCAAPCMGPVLGAILVLAGSTTTVAQGSVLLFAYSIGLAIPFVLAGIAFTRMMGVFRWLRDNYGAIRVVSGALLVGVGLLLFFDRIWWLSVAFERVLETVGLGTS